MIGFLWRAVRRSEIMSEHRYIACDLGAESGRVMVGTLVNGRLTLDEVHRFPSAVTREDGAVRWDVAKIFAELQVGLWKVAAGGKPIAGISVDSWAVDYVLIANGQFSGLPYHYRDPRNAISAAKVRARLGDKAIFETTGIQFLPFNTIYQLAAEKASNPMLDRADVFLTIADYFNYRFSGVAVVDESNASTTQLYDPRTRQWSRQLIEACELPTHLFPKIVPSGSVLGPLASTVDAGFVAPPAVIATCSHDTGAAVAAVPAAGGDDWAYLSSGTWSLLGVELPGPLINDGARRANFTNEAGFGGTTRFLKNIIGLWILQELRREWAANGRDVSYTELTELARQATPFRSLIHPKDERFVAAGDMVAKVTAVCRETNQPEPQTPGQFARCVLESLALLYRSTLEEMEVLTGRQIRHLHIVGGGSQSVLLNQFTANATAREVLAGPVEASAIGNVLVQAIALGHVPSIAGLRDIVRASFSITTFTPSHTAMWQAAYDRFAQLPVPGYRRGVS